MTLSATGQRDARGTAKATKPRLFSPEELPTTVELNGRLLRLNTDWRDILRCMKILQNDALEDRTKAEACLQVFVDNYKDIADAQAAMDALFQFIDCGEQPAKNGHAPKEMDWEIDFPVLISDMNRVAGKEIRAEPYMHWFTFVAWYQAVGEGNLTYRVTIRRKCRDSRKYGKLSADEAEWVRKNPDKIFK